jgi:hypothetical protein
VLGRGFGTLTSFDGCVQGPDARGPLSGMHHAVGGLR